MTKQTKAALPSLGANKLLDLLIDRGNLKNDAALSRMLKVAPPVVSKLRNGALPIGPSMVLNIHETFDLPVAAIRTFQAMDKVPA